MDLSPKSPFVIGDPIYQKKRVDYYLFGIDFRVKNSLKTIPVNPCLQTFKKWKK